ncbi:hypothetical protein HDU91_002675, partial [Kappamyces sp. JEL0680]
MTAVEMDYETGELIKDKLIPDAIDWFTGKALEEYEDGDYDEDDEEDFYGEEDEDDDDDDEDDKPAGATDKAPECKQ